MTKEQVAAKITEIGIVPVVRASSAKLGMQAAEAICAGGIPIVEITMTVPGAVELISQLAKSMGSNLLVGAGTVLDAGTAQRCLDAGAEFLVSPAFDVETIKLANRSQRLIMAGALTPTEVLIAWNAGSDFVKVFPCGNVGGAKYIKALKGPLPQIPLVPTGGVNLNTAAELIQAGAVALGVGGELVSPSALNSGDTTEITDNATKFVSLIRDTRNQMEASLKL